MNPRTLHLTAFAVAVFIADRKPTPEEIEQYFEFSRRKVERIITILRKAGFVQTLTRPITYEITPNAIPAIAHNDGRPLAEVVTTASTRGIDSAKPYYRTYRQIHKSGNPHGGNNA